MSFCHAFERLSRASHQLLPWALPCLGLVLVLVGWHLAPCRGALVCAWGGSRVDLAQHRGVLALPARNRSTKLSHAQDSNGRRETFLLLVANWAQTCPQDWA